METPEKFVIAFDTLCEGHQTCMTEDDDGNDVPLTFDTYDEAFKEMFDDALCVLLQKKEDDELEEYCPDVDPAIIPEMEAAFDSGDIERMKQFWEAHPEVNDNDEWVESTKTFQLGHKTFIYPSADAPTTFDSEKWVTG